MKYSANPHSFSTSGWKFFILLTLSFSLITQIPAYAQKRVCPPNSPNAGNPPPCGKPTNPVPIPALGVGLVGMGLGLVYKNRKTTSKTAEEQ
jgi:hypothetical protein